MSKINITRMKPKICPVKLLGKIEIGTVFTADIGPYKNHLFISSYDEVISLNDLKLTWSNDDVEFHNFQEVDIDIEVIQCQG